MLVVVLAGISTGSSSVRGAVNSGCSNARDDGNAADTWCCWY